MIKCLVIEKNLTQKTASLGVYVYKFLAQSVNRKAMIWPVETVKTFLRHPVLAVRFIFEVAVEIAMVAVMLAVRFIFEVAVAAILTTKFKILLHL